MEVEDQAPRGFRPVSLLEQQERLGVSVTVSDLSLGRSKSWPVGVPDE